MTTLLGTAPAGCGVTLAALAREVGEELVHERLEHDGRLRELNLTAFLEESFGAARTNAHVLAAEQPLRLDAGITVIRNTIERRFDLERDHSAVVARIEADGLDAADTRFWDGGLSVIAGFIDELETLP